MLAGPLRVYGVRGGGALGWNRDPVRTSRQSIGVTPHVLHNIRKCTVHVAEAMRVAETIQVARCIVQRDRPLE